MLVRLLSTQTKAKLILGAIGTGAAGWLLMPDGESPTQSTPSAQVAQNDEAKSQKQSPGPKLAAADVASDESSPDDEDRAKDDYFNGSRWKGGATADASDSPENDGGNAWPTDDQVTPASGTASSRALKSAPARDPFGPPGGSSASAADSESDSNSADPFSAPSYRNQPGAESAAAASDETESLGSSSAEASDLIDQGGDALKQEIENRTGIDDAGPLTDPLKQAAQSAADRYQPKSDGGRYGAAPSGASAWGGADPDGVDAETEATDSAMPPLGSPPPLKEFDDDGPAHALPPLPPLEAEATADVGDESTDGAATGGFAGDENQGGADPFSAPPATQRAQQGFVEDDQPDTAPFGPRPPLGSSRPGGNPAATPRELQAMEPDEGFSPPPGGSRFASPSTEAIDQGAAGTDTSTAVASRTVGGVYTAKGGESLFDVARRELGSPLRWVEIYELNEGQLAAGAKRLPKGVKLQMPER